VATKGITCNAVCPGYVMTELIEKQLESQARTRGIPKVRRGRGW
jgi:3-hydroxybutyrate dehydrogenase